MEIEVGNWNEEEVNATVKRIKKQMEELHTFEESFKEDYGISTYHFLKELMYVLEHSDMKYSTTTTGKTIIADYLGIERFLDKIVEEVKSHVED